MTKLIRPDDLKTAMLKIDRNNSEGDIDQANLLQNCLSNIAGLNSDMKGGIIKVIEQIIKRIKILNRRMV